MPRGLSCIAFALLFETAIAFKLHDMHCESSRQMNQRNNFLRNSNLSDEEVISDTIDKPKESITVESQNGNSFFVNQFSSYIMKQAVPRKQEGFSRRNAILKFATLSLAFPRRASGSDYNNVKSNVKLKGAAELDLEYYLKDIFSGNSLDPQLNRTSASNPARQIDARLAQGLNDLTLSRIQEYSNGMSLSKLIESIENYADKIEPSFQKKASFPRKDVSNQYRFDMISYATFKIASDIIRDSPKRVNFFNDIGSDAYDLLISILKSDSKDIPTVYNASEKNAKLTPLLKDLQLLLSELISLGFISKFMLDLGEFEEEDWIPNSSVAFQMNVYDPATLGSFVQASNEGNRFHADYVGPLLAAHVRKCNVQSFYEEYIFDSDYRPNPNEFVASEVLYQWNLEQSA